MVAINTDNKSKTVADAVCPNCFKLMENPTMMPERTDDFDRTLRSYLGWCMQCGLGFEVVQFLREDRSQKTEDRGQKKGRWIIHKCKVYAIIGEDKCKRLGEEIIFNELPEPAPIVIGPGEDFNQQIEIKQFELMNTLRKTLQSLCQTINCLMKTMPGRFGKK